jgi:SAM-dependent methyltransferase
VPYQSLAFQTTHPSRLAMIGRLFGLDPARPSHCRVLEIGCAAGGNLIPLAARYPESTFLGLDFSRVEIEQGQAEIAALALPNVTLRHQDITTYDPAADGLFDYVICHGVYSWVPPEAQRGILRASKAALAPQGVAYVSYNTYPGWKIVEVVRDVMNYHAGTRPTAKERVEQARAIVDFIREISDAGSVYGQVLASEAAVLKKAKDYYLLHEHLETHNAPCYFKDFMAAAAENGLSYLGEACLEEMIPQHLGAKVMDALTRVSAGDVLKTEQYMDFFRNRRFRRTLLVHAEAVGQVKRHIGPEGAAHFHYAGMYRIEAKTDAAVAPGEGAPTAPPAMPPDPLTGPAEIVFRDGERSLSSSRPYAKALMAALDLRWPDTYTVGEWKAAAEKLLAGKPELLAGGQAMFDEILVAGLSRGIVLVVDEPVVLGRATDPRPVVMPCVRLRARQGVREVPNQWHQTVGLDDVQLVICQLADGTRTVREIGLEIVERCVRGDLKLAQGGQQVTDRKAVEETIGGALPQLLKHLERMAVLVPGAEAVRSEERASGGVGAASKAPAKVPVKDARRKGKGKKA